MNPFRHKFFVAITGAVVCCSTPVIAQTAVPGRIAAPTLIEESFRLAHQALGAAGDSATNRSVGWQNLRATPKYKVWLDPDRQSEGSRSTGTVGTGALIHAAPLPVEGPYHQVIERHRKYGTQWGTAELVAVLLSGAQHAGEVSPGAPLRIGNLSKKSGGDIRWSRSHNSGRDADIAFFVKTKAEGASVVTPELLQFDSEGVPVGRPDLIFDVARNWLFIKGLLINPDKTVIQYVFVSDPLKAMLLDYAAKIGEPAELIQEANDVLHQPTDALPHDDHFHVRIACPLEDRLRGCLDAGPQWEWADWHADALLAQALEMSRGLNDPDPAIRLESLNFLEQIRSPYAADIALGFGVWNADPVIRERSLEVAKASWTTSGYSVAMARKFISSSSATLDEKSTAYKILGRSMDPFAREFALARLKSAEVSEPERYLAARSLGHFMDEDLVPELFAQLLVQPPAVRSEIAHVLMRIMNYGPEIDWAHASAESSAEATERWRTWSEDHGNSRATWLLAGLREYGMRISTIDTTQIDGLIGVLPKSNEYVVYNINRVLRETTGRWAPLEVSDGRKVFDYWSKWWRKNRDRVLAGGAEGDEE